MLALRLTLAVMIATTWEAQALPQTAPTLVQTQQALRVLSEEFGICTRAARDQRSTGAFNRSLDLQKLSIAVDPKGATRIGQTSSYREAADGDEGFHRDGVEMFDSAPSEKLDFARAVAIPVGDLPVSHDGMGLARVILPCLDTVACTRQGSIQLAFYVCSLDGAYRIVRGLHHMQDFITSPPKSAF